MHCGSYVAPACVENVKVLLSAKSKREKIACLATRTTLLRITHLRAAAMPDQNILGESSDVAFGLVGVDRSDALHMAVQPAAVHTGRFATGHRQLAHGLCAVCDGHLCSCS